jgi:hypothetical protein
MPLGGIPISFGEGQQRTEAMRKLRNVVKMLFLPIACFACVGWLAVFLVIGFNMPNQNIGLTTLIVLGGAAMTLPWMGLVLSMLRRVAGNDVVPVGQDPEQ